MFRTYAGGHYVWASYADTPELFDAVDTVFIAFGNKTYFMQLLV